MFQSGRFTLGQVFLPDRSKSNPDSNFFSRTAQDVKVFWFFSSEKNFFLYCRLNIGSVPVQSTRAMLPV